MEQFLLSLVAGIVSALSTQGMIYAFDARKSRRKSDHLALRLANEFERFAEECMSSICTNRDSWEESKNPDRQNASLPGYPKLFDDDPAWETLNRPLAAEILGFPQAVDHAAGYVRNEFYFGSPPTAWVTRDDQAVGLGVRAALIAKRLREVHGQHQPSFEWDYHERLDQEAERIESEKIEFQKQPKLIDDQESKAR